MYSEVLLFVRIFAGDAARAGFGEKEASILSRYGFAQSVGRVIGEETKFALIVHRSNPAYIPYHPIAHA
jgi:hypothetical protein